MSAAPAVLGADFEAEADVSELVKDAREIVAKARFEARTPAEFEERIAAALVARLAAAERELEIAEQDADHFNRLAHVDVGANPPVLWKTVAETAARDERRRAVEIARKREEHWHQTAVDALKRKNVDDAVRATAKQIEAQEIAAAIEESA